MICDDCHRVAAVVGEFKYDFHAADVPPLDAEESKVKVVEATAERRLPADSDELTKSSNWTACPPHFIFSPGSPGDVCSYSGIFTDALVRLVHHPRGGMVDIVVDGTSATSVDLFTEQGAFAEATIAASDLPVGNHTLVVTTSASVNPASAGRECILEELVLYGPYELEGFGSPQPLNFGNPYSPFIERYTNSAGADDLVLELGGGDRRYCRPNYLNFEYLKFELADVYGDTHSLPFSDDSFAYVCSQAVFEHLADPQAAAKEIIRVTKPGGLIITEVAFLQPLHAVPFHFFNMTLWGVQELFRSCELLASDWFGPLSGTVMWLLAASNLTEKIPKDQLERIRSEFESFDGMMTHDDLQPVASGVHIAVRKPE